MRYVLLRPVTRVEVNEIRLAQKLDPFGADDVQRREGWEDHVHRRYISIAGDFFEKYQHVGCVKAASRDDNIHGAVDLTHRLLEQVGIVR